MKTASFFTYQGPAPSPSRAMRHAGRIICPRCGCLAPTHDMLKMDEATYRALYFGNILGASMQRKCGRTCIGSATHTNRCCSVGSARLSRGGIGVTGG